MFLKNKKIEQLEIRINELERVIKDKFNIVNERLDLERDEIKQLKCDHSLVAFSSDSFGMRKRCKWCDKVLTIYQNHADFYQAQVEHFQKLAGFSKS